MAKAIFGFVGGFTFVDGVIETASNALADNISHAFSILPDKKGNLRTWEAEGTNKDGDRYPGFWDHDVNKWQADVCAKFVQIDVQNYEDGVQLAWKLRGTIYGYVDCIEGGIYELTGFSVPDTALTMDCSEASARILRAMGINVLPGLKAGSITPERLYKELVNTFHAIDITERIRKGVFE